MRQRITVAAIAFCLSVLLTGCTSANEPIEELGRESHDQSIVVPKVKVTNRDKNSIVVSISDEEEIAGYEVYRAIEQSSDFIYLNTVKEQEFTDSTVEEKKRYSYKVRAYVSDNDKTRYSNFSNTVSVEAALDAPQNVAVDNKEQVTTISFDHVDRATEYKVYRSDEEGKDGIYIGSTSDNAYVDTSAEEGKIYYYQVSAYAIINYVEYNSSRSNAIPSEQVDSAEEGDITNQDVLVEEKLAESIEETMKPSEKQLSEEPETMSESQEITDSDDKDTVVEQAPEATTTPTSQPATPTVVPTKKPSSNGSNSSGNSTIIIGNQNNSNNNNSDDANEEENDSDNGEAEEEGAASGNKTSLAKQVLTLVNEERTKAGLKELTMSSSLTTAATKRSTEIITSFSHTRPNGSQPQTVLKEYGISYNAFGENIAYGQQSAKAVMNAWMNSEGHRANILSSKFGKIGIGCVEKNGVLYWTQLFTN